MVQCVIGCGEVDKGSSSDYTFLISIFNELREVQELTIVQEFPGLKPACSGMRCSSTKGATRLSMSLSQFT